MEELVHAYLTRNCIIIDVIGDDIMCKETGVRKYHLAKELSQVFSISEIEARVYADSWSVKVKPDVDLCLYWVMTTPTNSETFMSPGVYCREYDDSIKALATTKYIIGVDQAICE